MGNAPPLSRSTKIALAVMLVGGIGALATMAWLVRGPHRPERGAADEPVEAPVTAGPSKLQPPPSQPVPPRPAALPAGPATAPPAPAAATTATATASGAEAQFALPLPEVRWPIKRGWRFPGKAGAAADGGQPPVRP
jgi:hypothetical protein